MNKVLLSAMTALTMLGGGTAAQAQNWEDVRDARRNAQEERRELRDAYRRGDRDDIREERREYNQAARRFDRERDRYERQRFGRDRFDGDRFDRQGGRFDRNGDGIVNRFDRNRFYQRSGDRFYDYNGSYYRRNGQFIPGPGDYYLNNGRYVRYNNARGWAGPNGRFYNDYYQCRRDNNLAGTAIGAALGGVVGNQVAPTGDRTAGTVLGGVLGGVLGNRIDAAGDRRRCF